MGSNKGDHGLMKQIKYVEENIKLKEKLGKDATFERSLVKAWRNWLPGGNKYPLWLAHSRGGNFPQDRIDKTVVEI